MTESKGSPNKRSKPLKYAYEKEIVLYAHHKKLDYFSTECIYSPEAFRGSARTLIKNMERIRPSAILDVVKSGEDMAQLVPKELAGSISCRGAAAGRSGVAEVEHEDEDEAVGGCGSVNGRTGGGEMAAMEGKLKEDEAAAGLETEITSSSLDGTRALQTKGPRRRNPMLKSSGKARGPQMGQCARCGYLSSQDICKACMLLEGLNKSRPRVSIGFGLEDTSNLQSKGLENVAIASEQTAL